MKAILLPIAISIAYCSHAQPDSSMCYIESIEISVEDTSTEIREISITSTDTTIYFESGNAIHKIGLAKTKEYSLKIATAKDTIEVKNLCEYISPNCTFAFEVTIPQNYSGSLFGIYTTTGGMILAAVQEFWNQDLKSVTPYSEIYVLAFPKSYEDFEMNHYLR